MSHSTLIIPAIDLKDGKCVRLKQGRMEDDTVFSDDPVAMADRWVKEGARRLHLVDLNGAFDGVPVHKEVVTAIAKAHPTLPIQLGGGVRSLETIRHYLEAGLTYIIIGTKAVEHARQGKKQHKAIEPANGRERQHPCLRSDIATQHQGEEGKGDEKDGEHGRYCLCSAGQAVARPAGVVSAKSGGGHRTGRMRGGSQAWGVSSGGCF